MGHLVWANHSNHKQLCTPLCMPLPTRKGTSAIWLVDGRQGQGVEISENCGQVVRASQDVTARPGPDLVRMGGPYFQYYAYLQYLLLPWQHSFAVHHTPSSVASIPHSVPSAPCCGTAPHLSWCRWYGSNESSERLLLSFHPAVYGTHMSVRFCFKFLQATKQAECNVSSYLESNSEEISHLTIALQLHELVGFQTKISGHLLCKQQLV